MLYKKVKQVEIIYIWKYKLLCIKNVDRSYVLKLVAIFENYLQQKKLLKNIQQESQFNTRLFVVLMNGT